MNRLTAFAFAALSLSACNKGSSTTKAGHDFSSTRKVAIVSVSGCEGDLAAQNQVSDYLKIEFVKRGYDVVEREQLSALMKEQEFQASGVTEGNAAKAGRILNVPAVVLINIPDYGEKVALTAKMIDVETGSIVWIGEGTGKMDKWGSTAAGAVVGAVAGGFAGSRVGGDSGAGTKVGAGVGGVLGGLAGRKLEPTEVQVLQKIVKKMARGLPKVA